jgi:hypothetical protein
MSVPSVPLAPAPERSRRSVGAGAPGRLAAVTALGPRFLTAGAYLAAWVVPERLPPGLAKALLVGLILEFLLTHSYPFLNILLGTGKGASVERRVGASLGVLGFGAIYLLMAGVIGWATQSMTPVWTIVWLLGSRIFEIVIAGEPSSAAAQTRTASWMRNVWLYLLLIVLTAIVPLPALGLTPEIVAGLHLPGSGDWVEQPQHALAFGFLYFGLGAYFDLRARLRR